MRIDDGDGGLRGGCVVARHVDFRIAGGCVHDFLRAVVLPEDFCVHQHTAVGRPVEPAQVEHGLRLARPHEVPFSVDPRFHPGVVVVGMCPARGIDLSRGDADGAEGGNGEGRLFPASAVGGLDGSQRRAGAGV